MVNDFLLKAVDKVRGLPDSIGLRNYSLSIRITATTLPGSYLGDLDSPVVMTETPIKLANGRNPSIKNTSAKSGRADLAGSERYFSITLTPGFDVGGFSISNLTSNSSIDYIIKGVDLPVDGISCRLISHTQTSTKVTLVVKSYGK